MFDCFSAGPCRLRPEGVPRGAKFHGTWKDGNWVKCSEAGEHVSCEIFQDQGSLFVSGAFKIVDHVAPCTGAFAYTIYPFQDQFVVALRAKTHTTKNPVEIFNARTEEVLEEEILSAFQNVRGITLVDPQIEIEWGTVLCESDGRYHITNINEPWAHGRIWNHTIFEIRTEGMDN